MRKLLSVLFMLLLVTGASVALAPEHVDAAVPKLTPPHFIQANMVWLNADTCDYANGWCAVYACSTRALASPVANIQEYFHGYYSSDYRGINDPASAECDRLVFWVDGQTDLIQIVVDCGGINCYSVWVSRYW